MSTLQQELDQYQKELGRYRDLFLEDDGTIDKDEQKRLDALAEKISKIQLVLGLGFVGESGGSAKKTASVTVKGPQPGSGGETWDDSKITFTPSAVLHVNGRIRSESKFSGGSWGNVEIDAGQSGQLTLFMKIEGTQDNQFSNEDFEQDLTVSWDIAADNNGALTIEPPQEKWGAPSEGTYFRLDSVNPVNGKSFVQISPIIAGGADSGGISVGVGIGREAPPPKIKETFRLDIKVKVPKVPDPKGTVEIGDWVTVIQKHDYTVGPFKVASANTLESGNIKKYVYDILHQWLPTETRDEILNSKLAGGEKIEVHGYTSNTDSENRNFRLSKERAKTVLAEFKSLGAPASVFTEPIPHGEWETQNPTDDKRQEKEDSDWRKVVLKIKHEMTFKVDPKTGEVGERIK